MISCWITRVLLLSVACSMGSDVHLIICCRSTRRYCTSSPTSSTDSRPRRRHHQTWIIKHSHLLIVLSSNPA